MTQRVVVVGATGHIGRPLCGELLGTGAAVNHWAWLAVPSPFRFPVLDAALRDLLSDLGETAGTAR